MNKREKWLKELAETAVGLSADWEKAIRQIRLREKSRWQFHRIRTTLNRLHSEGLSAVDVTIHGEDDTVQGWDSITDPE